MAEVPPIVLSAIVCERVIFDKITGMPSLVNIVQHVNAPKYPVRYGQLVFFCELTNGHGKTKTRIRIVNPEEDDKVLFEKDGILEFKDIKQVVTLGINVQGVVFERPGEYRFQLYAGERLMTERAILCREVSLPGQDGVAEEGDVSSEPN